MGGAVCRSAQPMPSWMITPRLNSTQLRTRPVRAEHLHRTDNDPVLLAGHRPVSEFQQLDVVEGAMLAHAVVVEDMLRQLTVTLSWPAG